MEVLKRDVTGPITLVPFPPSDKGYALCNVTDDGRLKINGLDAN